MCQGVHKREISPQLGTARRQNQVWKDRVLALKGKILPQSQTQSRHTSIAFPDINKGAPSTIFCISTPQNAQTKETCRCAVQCRAMQPAPSWSGRDQGRGRTIVCILEELRGTHGGKYCIQVWVHDIRNETKMRQILVPIGTGVDTTSSG